MKYTENFRDFVNERMIKPRSGHNYYILSKDVPVKYIESQSNPTGATGILLHNKEGYIDGQKGAYIIDYFGGHYYVDMENKYASHIYKLKDQHKTFRDALIAVDEAPEHADWKGFMREIPFEGNDSSARHSNDYSSFLNERAKNKLYLEGIMSELDIMAKEAKSLKDFMEEVFAIDIYQKHKGNKDVEKFLADFYKDNK